MKKLLVIHSVIEPTHKKAMASELARIFANSLNKEVLSKLRIETLVRNLREEQEQIPRNYDAYLIHPRDVNNGDLKLLRIEQPSSVVYCTNRHASDVSDEERELYTDFIWFMDDEEANRIAERLGVLK